MNMDEKECKAARIKSGTTDAPQSQHPRRRCASESVSLIHPSPTTKPSTSSEDEGSGASKGVFKASGLEQQPTYQKESSGESSNPERWFEKSNNNVGKNSVNFTDDEPPFFLRNSSSDETPPQAMNRERATAQRADGTNSGFGIDSAAAENESDDFRSVIDDLTIENKKLKRKLRQYEKCQISQPRDDKLFEIRVHGLSAPKKKELEDLLKNFVTSLDSGPKSHTSRGPSYGPSSLQNLNTTSSITSTRFGDSGYGTISTSGRNSLSQTKNTVASKQVMRNLMSRQQEQVIHSYLHDIPIGLLPRDTSPLTEKAKCKMVVRRLEQIFAGKSSALSGHQHPIQQERVAQSAARADRRAIEATGKRALGEGSREAPIMKGEADVDTELSSATPRFQAQKSMDSALVDQEMTELEQRPTRPLDLDPFRAQVPADNMKYMRHLGFSPSYAPASELQEDGHGWVYLNLLTNMAQLHTINVTPEFIRRAVLKYSNKLELSQDGRKVRWKGGDEMTLMSIENSPDSASYGVISTGKTSAEGRADKATSKATTGSSEVSSEGARGASGRNTRDDGSGSKLKGYTPIFHNEESEDGAPDDAMTYWISNATGNTSCLSDIASRTKRSQFLLPDQKDDGPIIFYNKAGFFTDLSGDSVAAIARSTAQKRSNYHRVSTDPIGLGSEASAAMESHRVKDTQKGPISRLEMSLNPAPKNLESIDNSGSSVDESAIRVNLTKASSGSSNTSPDPIEFEASGVGGVLPTDNFSINVRSKQNTFNQKSTAEGQRHRAYPLHIRNAFKETADQKASTKQGPKNQVYEREIITSRLKNLPASSLPPPSYYPFSSPEQDIEYDDEDDDDEGFETDSENSVGKAGSISGQDGNERLETEHSTKGNWANTVLLSRRLDANSDSDEESEESEDSEEANDSHETNDGEDHYYEAEELDDDDTPHNTPLTSERARLRKRELMSNMADRLAEEIPAGSSAATADGGSGFGSPMVVSKEQASRSQRRSNTLKRARRSDDSIPAEAARVTKSPKLERSD